MKKHYFAAGALIFLTLTLTGCSQSGTAQKQTSNTPAGPLDGVLNDAKIKARDAKRIADVKKIQLGLELYSVDKNSYPTDLNLLLLPAYEVTNDNLKGPSGDLYSYTKEKDDKYKLCFTLENGKDAYPKGLNCLNQDSE